MADVSDSMRGGVPSAGGVGHDGDMHSPRAVGDEIRNVEEEIAGLKEEAKKVEDDIRRVEEKITDVEHEIKSIESQLSGTSDREERGYLQQEKHDLRQKEQTLRQKEQTLRQKEQTLRQKEQTLRQEEQTLRQEEQTLRQVEHDLRQKEHDLRQMEQALLSTGLENGRQLKDNHPLSKFVACLHDSTVQESIKSVTSGSVIKLPEGIHWLGDSTNCSNELFMRPCYFELLEAKVEYFQLKPKLRVVVYTGTPGIGKSHLCAYVVALKLIEGTVVFFERRPTSTMNSARTQFYRLDLKNGARELDSLKVLGFLEEDESAVYIVDGGPPSEFDPLLETQVFASPSKELFVARRKSWDYLYLHTPLFDLTEIKSCRSLVSGFASKVTMKTVEEWFFVAGGVARVVLKEASDGLALSAWKQRALTLVAETNAEHLQSMIAGVQMDTFVPGSDMLFHWRVAEENVPASTAGSSPEKKSFRRFQRKMVCFASGWIVKQFFLKLRLEKFVNLVAFILSHSWNDEVAAHRGYWFETLSHMMISSGGTFKCRWLDTCKEFKLELPEAELCAFEGKEDAALAVKDDLSAYCLPTMSNQVAIDSMSSPYLLFEMTTATTHSINNEGLSYFLKALEDGNRFTQAAWDFVKSKCNPPRATASSPLFVFCTTPANFCLEYKTPQSFVNRKRKADEGVAIQQIVLEIPIDFVEYRLEGDLRLKVVAKLGQ